MLFIRAQLIFLLLIFAFSPALAETEPRTGAAGELGWATYYAKRFAGQKTASGEIYDPAKLTAAHTRLPFGSQVRVVNIANGRSVVVTVNDRCRSRKHPYIDISRAAAREIGLLGRGNARVRIISEGTPVAAAANPRDSVND